MTDFFKNNPIALRHCLLYEYLRKSRVERIFDAFPIVFGDDVIKKEEYQVWFDQFKQGIFDTSDVKKPITDMKEVLRSDKHALRACIFYELLKYKQVELGSSNSDKWPDSNLADRKVQCDPSFFMYNNFCNVVGDDVMEFREFDFWFYRFLNEEFDWSFERDKDKRILELSDMPIDVMENIVEYLDIFDRVNLAKASQSLQTFVKNQKLFHHTLKLSVFHPRITISFSESVDFKYNQNGEDCLKNYKKREKIVRGVAYSDQAILDFTSVLKNPKLHLDTLEIEFRVDDVMYLDDEYTLSDLKDALKFTHHLNVKNLIIVEYSWELLAETVPMLKPGYLKTIDINSSSLYDLAGSMKKVFETEQWKRAKCFFMDGTFFMWPLHHLYHFEKFTVSLEKLSVENIRHMKETLFNSPNFEKCSIWVDDDIKANAIGKEFGVGTWEDENNPEFMKIYRYPIFNSTDYFEITVEPHFFEVTRKKK